MKCYIFLLLSAWLAPAVATAAPSAWVQLAPGGGAEARLVTTASSCPAIQTDGKAVAMQLRAVSDPNFPLVCSAPLPAGVKTASIGGIALPLPVADPQRILVFGDTGCRIKGPATQACNDPAAWPFPEIAKAAAALKPDLVLHVGDYLYRESACPTGNTGCANSPHGDNWASWDADFFTPAAPLLAAAPWIIVRGNHEDCQRAGAGFLRLLGPLAYDPATPCIDHLSPWVTKIGSQTIAIMDDASAPDTTVDDKLVPVYAKDFEALKAIENVGPGQEIWLTMHRPIWAAISGPLGLPVGGNATLIAAAGDLSTFAAVSLLLSGHIHTFEAINYEAKIPPQIVAGFGGDNLDVTPANLSGAIFQGSSGVHVKTGLSIGGFGFLMMTRNGTGWSIQLYDASGKPTHACAFAGAQVVCLRPK